MPQNPTNRNEWIFGEVRNPLTDKDSLIKFHVINMLNKTIRIFKYKGLPDTISQKDLETQLQVNGFAIINRVSGELYSFTGGLGGKPNVYYLPTLAIVANPALAYNASLEIDKDCVVVLNDTYYQGFMPMFNKNAAMLAEAEISLRYAIINGRVPALVQADTDTTAESARAFFDKIERGDGYGIITSYEFTNGIVSQDFFKQPYIKDLIESIQYIKGSWYNEIGLNSTFNMKREAINEAEASLNEDILYPYIDTLMECRKIGFEKVNKMFGTNIEVEFDSSWLTNLKQEAYALKQEKNLAEGGDDSNEDKGNSDGDGSDESSDR